MFTMNMVEMEKFLGLIKTGKTSLMIYSSPKRGLIAAIVKEFPEIVRVTPSNLEEISCLEETISFFRQNAGKPILLVLDSSEHRISSQLGHCLREHIDNDGRVIITCQNAIVIAQHLISRLVLVKIE